ncbi:E3 ubiquitin-protein ligase RBBP6 isoform X2 [Cottoperca gobio]|uniref:E3 ubiquitin-protein ligase RBBP6 isoform X2 n=1 Tax=Cottoperca gobio TaxID=56716 RepID=A0A6J2Q500_COTGO|nr:E3 ubiquitin-protein ligase RBBP6 isoform X2 [Cottoperca gobio]
MTHVHYKFSSKLSYDTVVFDGLHVTLRDLKRQIMGREKLRAGDCDLQITNAQNKEEYTDDEGSIPKGSSVIVRRIPIIGGKSSSHKTRHIERSDLQTNHAFGAFKAMDDQNSSRAVPFFTKMANLADVDVSEEDKIKVMMNQSAFDLNYNKKFTAGLPANYTCYRCGSTGHHIRNCPTSGDKNLETPVRIKKSSGIPRSFMVEVDDPSIKGAMLTSCGRYAVPAIDAEAYAIGKKERPPFVPQENPQSEDEEDPVPEELLCLICHDLLSDAVVIPCCGNSYCDDCIRTALLDSEEHVCPTCSQSDVSPDTLIANKFLRQAVDNFKKERGFAKSLKRGSGASQSQNPTPTPSPAPTPSPLTVQSQPPKPFLSINRQQDPLRHNSQAVDTPPSSQVCGATPTATSPASSPSTSLQPVQSILETPNKEAEEKTHGDTADAAAAPSVPVSPKDPTDAPSKLIPLVELTPVGEQPQTVSVNLQPLPSGPPPRPPGPSTCWESSSSPSGCPTGGWTQPNTQKRPPSSSSYPATPPPPLFPSPHFHTFLTAPQPLSPYPPGYPPAVWTLPNLQGAPIPSLCPSTAIPALIPKEWYRHQKKKERSPHRGSSHRRSSSRSNSKSSNSKSSRSYSRSSSRSRSRSRSRSQGRSRPHSSYSHHRDPPTRSNSSHSYSYGYKRSPTPSSSSSPRVAYHSRSKSPSDHRKNSHHSRHHNKKSSSSSHDSRRRGEHHGSGGSLASNMYAQHANQSSSLDLDRERYLQWKGEYKEWCDKYFSSYVGHFHQMPLPLLNLLRPPQWGNREESGHPLHANSDSHNQLQGRRTARLDGRSPPSQSSSDSRSPPSQSSRYRRSTPSQSSSDSHSSPSHSSSDSRSPPSQSSSDGRSTPSEDGAQPRASQQSRTEKYSRLPIAFPKGSEEVDLQEGCKDKLITKNLENRSSLKHEQKSMKKYEKDRKEESDSTEDCRKEKRRHNPGTKACKGGSPARDEATASDALESARPLLKPDKRLDKDYERKRREQNNSEMEKGCRRGEHSDSRKDVGRRHREKPKKEAGRVDTDRYRDPGGSRASDSRSEKNRKRKREDTERGFVKAQSSKCLKDPETPKSESPNPFDRKKPKMEKKMDRKPWPLTERDIWEGGIKVKPQKKISININLEGKMKDESVTGKTQSEIDAGNRTEIEANEKKESSRDMEGVSGEQIKPEGEARQKWEKATFRDDAGEEKDIGEKKDVREKEDFDVWHSPRREVEEESKKQWDERDGMAASKGEEVTNDRRRSVRRGKEGQATGELVAETREERAEGESPFKVNRGNLPGESKPEEAPMEGGKWREEGDTMRSKSQKGRNKGRHDGPKTALDGGSYEDLQEKKTEVTTLEEYTQDRAADQEDKLVVTQVPRSKWEKEKSEEGAIEVQADALATFLPSPSMSVTAETATTIETDHGGKRERAVEIERGRYREREKTPILSTSQSSVAPSSGRDRTDRDGEKRMDRRRDRERERERSRNRPKESKRSKERTREGETGREQGRFASAPKRNPPSSSHSYSYSYSMSHDTERKDRQREGDPVGKFSGGSSRENGVISRATKLPDEKVHKTYRDTLLGSNFKDKDHTHNDQEEGGRELEEGERRSSRSNSTSSSASRENGRGDGRKEKKQKKHKQEKRQAAPELLKKQKLEKKTSKKSRDGRGEESSGEEDDAKLCSVMLS